MCDIPHYCVVHLDNGPLHLVVPLVQEHFGEDPGALISKATL